MIDYRTFATLADGIVGFCPDNGKIMGHVYHVVANQSDTLRVVVSDVKVYAIASILSSHIDFLDVDVVAQRVGTMQDTDESCSADHVNREVLWGMRVDNGCL